MPKFVQIHFTPEATAQIQRVNPQFAGNVVFQDATYCEPCDSGVTVVCPATEADRGKFVGDEVDYFYPWHQVARLKQAELAD